MTLEAGKLNHRLTLQGQTQTQDPDTGEIVSTWGDIATVWGHVEPVSVREFIQSAAGQVDLTARITLRYRPSLSAVQRIVHRGVVYDIHGVLADKVSGLEYVTLPASTASDSTT